MSCTKASTVFCALLALALPVTAQNDWSVQWSNGFKMDSPDGSFKLQFGGRLQADWSFPSGDFGVEEGNEIRRAQIFFAGTVYDNVEFKAEYDFAGGEADFKDVYLGLVKTPVGGIRAGYFKEPFSLEELTSSKYVTFLERSLPVTAFAPSRNTGLMVHDTGERWGWAFGYFRESDDFGGSTGDGKSNLTGRVVFRPLFADGGEKLLHLGVAYTQKDLGDASYRYRTRPEAHLSPRLVDTGSFAADGAGILGLEAAVVAGPFWAAGEWIQNRVDSSAVGDPSLDGFYVQAGYYLTGESRRYKASEGAFDRQKPKASFGKDGGKGAWEVALRYSTVDLSDAGLSGGEQDDLTVALNWYLNPVTRFMLNYVSADVDGAGEEDFVLLRLQVDF